MKTLILVRHAKAEARREYESDFDRILLKKGVKDAKKMAETIKNRVSGKTLFMSGNTNRAFETAHLFAEKLGYPAVKILLKDMIYNNPSQEQFLELIKKIEDSYETVIIFGHNPSLSEFASYLIKDFEFDIPQAGIAAFSFDKKRWQEIEKQSGILKFAEYPVKRSKGINLFESTFTTKISEAISEALKNINPNAAGNI